MYLSMFGSKAKPLLQDSRSSQIPERLTQKKGETILFRSFKGSIFSLILKPDVMRTLVKILTLTVCDPQW
jgi:hypothetical protein